MSNKLKTFTNGIIKENPVLVLVLGINALSSYVAKKLVKKTGGSNE